MKFPWRSKVIDFLCKERGGRGGNFPFAEFHAAGLSALVDNGARPIKVKIETDPMKCKKPTMPDEPPRITKREDGSFDIKIYLSDKYSKVDDMKHLGMLREVQAKKDHRGSLLDQHGFPLYKAGEL